MEACERLGIPLRRLHGWEPATTTTYQYDESGRVARTVTTSEPLWDQWDHYLMIALQEFRDMHCSQCGQLLSECMVPDSMTEKELAYWSAKHYEAGYNRCGSCYRISYEQGVMRSMEKDKSEEYASGTDFNKWYVKRL